MENGGEELWMDEVWRERKNQGKRVQVIKMGEKKLRETQQENRRDERGKTKEEEEEEEEEMEEKQEKEEMENGGWSLVECDVRSTGSFLVLSPDNHCLGRSFDQLLDTVIFDTKTRSSITERFVFWGWWGKGRRRKQLAKMLHKLEVVSQVLDASVLEEVFGGVGVAVYIRQGEARHSVPDEWLKKGVELLHF